VGKQRGTKVAFWVVSVATLVLVPLLTLAAARGASTQGARAIPERIHDQQGRLAWISAESIERGGETLLQLDQPGSDDAGWLLEARRQRASASPVERLSHARCLEYIGASAGWPRYDFDERAISSSNILVGTVVAVAEGVFYSSPEVLLLVAVDDWTRRHEEMPSSSLAYVRFVPPEIEIAGVPVCRSLEGYAPAPGAGARLLVMSAGPRLVVAGMPVIYPGHMVMYDGFVGGDPALMASDRILEGSEEGLVDATVADLEDRIRRVAQSPGEVMQAVERRATERTARAMADIAAAEAVNAAFSPADADPPAACALTGECLHAPLVLDLGPLGILTSSINGSAALFDIDGDNRREHTAWLSGPGRDAFLWLDIDHNGRVDGAHEFVGAPGTSPLVAGRLATNGFEVLALYDRPEHGGDGDGAVNEGDEVWSRLLLWSDNDGDGVSTPQEIAAVGSEVVSIDLSYERTRERDGSINRVVGRGSIWIRGPRRDLREREMLAYLFRFTGQVRRPVR
jgi:hypothetical protein